MLSTLLLKDTEITDQALKSLLQKLDHISQVHRTSFDIDISNNGLTDTSIRAIADCLKKGRTLRSVVMSSIKKAKNDKIEPWLELAASL